MTVRERNGRFQAIVVLKRDGVIVHQESKMFATRALAKSWREQVMRKLKADGVESRKLAKATLGDLIDNYRKARADAGMLRPSHGEKLEYLKQLVGDWRLDGITATKVASMARKRRADGAGASTVMRNLAMLRAIMNSARPMFGLDVDGAQVEQAIDALGRMGLVANSSKREVRATDETLLKLQAEFDRVRAAYPHYANYTALTWIAVHFPRRLNELCSMRWEDYKDSKMVLRDTKHPTRPRTEVVPVPPKARAIIDALPRVDARILPYNPESVSSTWRRIADRVGVTELHFHDLRHEGICRLFEAGLQIQDVALISGHLSWNTLRRYTHIQPESVLEKLK